MINQDQDLSASEKKMLLRIRDRLVGGFVMGSIKDIDPFDPQCFGFLDPDL